MLLWLEATKYLRNYYEKDVVKTLVNNLHSILFILIASTESYSTSQIFLQGFYLHDFFLFMTSKVSSKGNIIYLLNHVNKQLLLGALSYPSIAPYALSTLLYMEISTLPIYLIFYTNRTYKNEAAINALSMFHIFIYGYGRSVVGTYNVYNMITEGGIAYLYCLIMQITTTIWLGFSVKTIYDIKINGRKIKKCDDDRSTEDIINNEKDQMMDRIYDGRRNAIERLKRRNITTRTVS